MRIALIDYQAGNLTSVRKALKAVGADVFTPAAPAALAGADAVIVPGVGHFSATRVLDASWRGSIAAAVGGGTPLLGICLGLQFLFEGSEEAPDLPGLGLLPGRCYLLDACRSGHDGWPLKVPHVGWNALAMVKPSPALQGIGDGSQAYFTHSYVAPVTTDTVATTEHGSTFASVVERGVIVGAQFHPEKSGDVGLLLLRNFLEIVRAAHGRRS